MAKKSKKSKKGRKGKLNANLKRVTKTLQAPFAKLGLGSMGIFGFLRDSFKELGHVKWLERKQALRYSVYVIVFLLFTGGLIALMDFGFTKLISFITST